MKKQTNLITVKLSVARAMLEEDFKVRPANKSSNMPLINLINLINNDDLTITCERASATSNLLNRGSMFECLIRLWLLEQKTSKKRNAKMTDLYINGEPIEVKYASAKGYASLSKMPTTRVLFGNQYGIYLTTPNNLVLDNCQKHIKTIKINKDTQTLVEW